MFAQIQLQLWVAISVLFAIDFIELKITTILSAIFENSHGKFTFGHNH